MNMAGQSPPAKQTEPLDEHDSQNQEKPHKSAEMQVEEYQDLKSTMVDSASHDGRTMQAYSNMFNS